VTESQEPDNPDGEIAPPPGVPRWVKISGLVVLVVAVVLVVVMLVVGGEHGPGQHSGAASVTVMTASQDRWCIGAL
jgi:hypothetical protein